LLTRTGNDFLEIQIFHTIIWRIKSLLTVLDMFFISLWLFCERWKTEAKRQREKNMAEAVRNDLMCRKIGWNIRTLDFLDYSHWEFECPEKAVKGRLKLW
jgi:hypothetical protein